MGFIVNYHTSYFVFAIGKVINEIILENVKIKYILLYAVIQSHLINIEQ